MVRVYRIETEQGRGICSVTGSSICQHYRDSCHDEREHCIFARKDELRACELSENPDMLYAFPTIESLRIWFPQERGRKLMADHGAHGVIYEVDHTEVASRWQCIFDRRRAASVGTFDLGSATI